MFRRILAALAVCTIVVSASFAANVKNYFDSGKENTFNVEGTQNVKSGGQLNVQAGGKFTNAGQDIFTPATQTGITTSSGVVPTSPFMIVTSSGGAVVNTANPVISTSTYVNGTRVILMGGSDTDSVTFSDGANWALGASTRALGLGDILEVILYNGIWYEKGFVNN